MKMRRDRGGQVYIVRQLKVLRNRQEMERNSGRKRRRSESQAGLSLLGFELLTIEVEKHTTWAGTTSDDAPEEDECEDELTDEDDC